MSIRVYLRNDFTPSGKHPQGCHYFTTQHTNQVTLHCEGGVFYFTLSTLMDPIHPELRPHISRVTYQGKFTDMSVYGNVHAGSYSHGKFLADVTISGGDRVTVRAVTVTAKAPTLPLLARWVRVILAGEDTPRIPRRPQSQAAVIDIPALSKVTSTQTN